MYRLFGVIIIMFVAWFSVGFSENCREVGAYRDVGGGVYYTVTWRCTGGLIFNILDLLTGREKEDIIRSIQVDLNPKYLKTKSDFIGYDKENVYCKGSLIKDFDIDTYVKHRRNFAGDYFADKNGVYVLTDNGCRLLEGIDSSTFTVLNNHFSKDKNGVYRDLPNQNNRLEGIDPLTFQVFDHSLSKDKYGVYHGQPSKSSRLLNIDQKTFNPVEYYNPKNTPVRYYKDSQNVYHYNYKSPLKVVSRDPDGFGLIDTPTKYKLTQDLRYFKDSSGVYYVTGDSEGEIDSKFVSTDIDGFAYFLRGISGDSNNVYKNGELVVGETVTSYLKKEGISKIDIVKYRYSSLIFRLPLYILAFILVFSLSLAVIGYIRHKLILKKV